MMTLSHQAGKKLKTPCDKYASQNLTTKYMFAVRT